MNTFWLKIIACVTMLLDHTAVMLNQVGLSEKSMLFIGMRSIGRMAFPIFAFLIATGFRYTRNRPNYLLRLMVCAVVSQPFFIWLLAQKDVLINLPHHWNTLFTLATGILCLMTLELYRQNERSKALWLAIPLAPMLILMTTEFWDTDYGITGVLLILMLYLLPSDRPALSALLVLLWGWCLRTPDLPTMLGFLPAATAIFFYNQQPGRKIKWFFYAFYPAHLAALCLVRLFL